MKKLLFICLGNICRSPSAEGIMQSMVEKEGLEKQILCDSAGTAAYHSGEAADSRMRMHAKQRGYNLASRARQFNPEVDFDKFDYILTMDEQNYYDIVQLDVTGKYKEKIYRMSDFARKMAFNEVPDPYYGGERGFETVLDILEDSCQTLLEKIKADPALKI